MGITKDTLDRLNRLSILEKKETPIRMLELGCQNIYDQSYEGVTYGMIAKPYFESFGIEHLSWDITGCQLAEKVDLRQSVDVEKYGQFDVVSNFGTLEHVENTDDGGFYESFKNVHNLCKVGGLMIHETPMTGHWIGHGCNYVTQDFYKQLAEDNAYEIVELCEHFAMGNTTDGGLVCCVLRKHNDAEFVDKEVFEKYDYRNS